MGERGAALRAATEFCRARMAAAQGPLLLGISGPQGGGKSTLAAGLVAAAEAEGKRALAISIDDFYLTHAEQAALAAANPDNPYLAYRGYPGTHDVALGARTLASLRAGRETRVPAYDKSAHGGRGDRAPESSFRIVSGPLDLIILDGWMLGFQPAPAASLGDDPHLALPNARLAGYRAWCEPLDACVVLVARAEQDIVAWRVDAERARREKGQPGLTDDEARDYIERCLPAYRAWVPGLLAWARARPSLLMTLGSDREPLD